MTENRITKLFGIKYPIIQAPMSWITNAEMVAAVCNAGGMGTLGPNAGQTTTTADPDETAERMRREIQKTRELTDKKFAINILGYDAPGNPFVDPLLKVMKEENATIASVIGTLDTDFIKRLKSEGFTVIFREVTPTAKSAALAEEAGADVVVATGFDEGGGLPNEIIGTMAIVPIIADAVKKVPVMAAGSIADKRGVKAAFALGAEGVYCGTVFVASKECPAAQITKDQIVSSSSSDLVLFKAENYWRCIPNKFSRDNKARNERGDFDIHAGQGWFKSNMLEGNVDEGVNTVSNAVSLIKEIRPVKEIIESMFDGVDF